ncbi:MAG: adenosylcobinamide-GDP ribazoletransferase [Armatimonadetes bacterium]|nr:adenosylcobinamide-GDP ribazoletransferase [Armatimonadota bacterium]
MFPFLLAITFLTRIPLPLRREVTPDALRRSLRYYPLVGVLVGLAMAGVRWAVREGWDSTFLADAAALVAMFILTGGLHLDGLMDCCDGLFGGASRERALEIMKDSRIGSYAFLGGLSDIMLRLALMDTLSPQALLLALPLSCALGRLGLVYGLTAGFPARESGLGRMFADLSTRQELAWAGLLVIPFVALGKFPSLIISTAVCLLWWLMVRYFQKRLGGVTGDTLGAMNELTEIFFLAGFGLLSRWM